MAPILSDVPAGTGNVTFFKLTLPRMLTSDVSAFMARRAISCLTKLSR